jgi:hypothetical protein
MADHRLKGATVARTETVGNQASRSRDVPARPPRRRRQFVPPQHGAWAMLAVPYLAGVIVAGARWPDLPLLGAWLAGYLFSYYFFLAVKTRRVTRVREQLLVYGGIALPLAVTVVALRPHVLLFAPAYAVLFGVNAWYARRRRERDLLNDAASVVQSCLLVFVVALVAGAPLQHVVGTFGVCLAYFLTTVLHVKSIIRERGNPAFRRWSVAGHAAALLALAWYGPYVAGLFAWLLVRAVWLQRRDLTPKQAGIVEIVNSGLLLGCVALTWA